MKSAFVSSSGACPGFVPNYRPAVCQQAQPARNQTSYRSHISMNGFDSTSSNSGGWQPQTSSGGIQEIEYVIHQDGRVEQLVRGVKGEECIKITQEIEETLGVVTAQIKTEEYFEQRVQLDQSNENRLDGSSGTTNTW